MIGNYEEMSAYYRSPEWASKRNERLKMDGYKCARCGFTRALEVHHITYERFGHEDVSRDLVTLCKKCHREVEEQKSSVNPVRRPTEHHSVYLAGKISMTDWRCKITRYELNYDAYGDINPGQIVAVNEGLSVTGPFFISCDHGCYHGDGKHGVGAVNSDEWPGCLGRYFSKDEVLEICKKQIESAEIVFAYIDGYDCYGTLAEIGYAHALGKDIVIAFNSEELKKEMWFADKMQRNTGVASDKWIHEQLISKFEEVY